MARKQRRRTARQRPRPQAPGPQQGQPAQQPPQPGQAQAAAAAAPAAPRAGSPRVGGDQALVRAVEMSLAPGAAPTRRGGRIVLPESADAAIPLDRVPYFTTDLIRVAITGVVMIALLVLAALIVIPKVVK